MKEKKHARGGNATLEKYGIGYFSKISRSQYKDYWKELKAHNPEEYKKRHKAALKRRKIRAQKSG